MVTAPEYFENMFAVTEKLAKKIPEVQATVGLLKVESLAERREYTRNELYKTIPELRDQKYGVALVENYLALGVIQRTEPSNTYVVVGARVDGIEMGGVVFGDCEDGTGDNAFRVDVQLNKEEFIDFLKKIEKTDRQELPPIRNDTLSISVCLPGKDVREEPLHLEFDYELGGNVKFLAYSWVY